MTDISATIDRIEGLAEEVAAVDRVYGTEWTPIKHPQHDHDRHGALIEVCYDDCNAFIQCVGPSADTLARYIAAVHAALPALLSAIREKDVALEPFADSHDEIVKLAGKSDDDPANLCEAWDWAHLRAARAAFDNLQQTEGDK